MADVADREVDTLYTVGRTENQEVRELLITNYDPPTNLLGLC